MVLPGVTRFGGANDCGESVETHFLDRVYYYGKGQTESRTTRR